MLDDDKQGDEKPSEAREIFPFQMNTHQTFHFEATREPVEPTVVADPKVSSAQESATSSESPTTPASTTEILSPDPSADGLKVNPMANPSVLPEPDVAVEKDSMPPKASEASTQPGSRVKKNGPPAQPALAAPPSPPKSPTLSSQDEDKPTS